jgi:DNA-binding HxlR family transcriptional regulator
MDTSTLPKPSGRWDVLSAQCPTREVLSRIGEKWTMLVITALAAEDGLVSRHAKATVPVTVEYRLTPLGHSLADTVHVLREWAYANIDRIERARTRYDRSA